MTFLTTHTIFYILFNSCVVSLRLICINTTLVHHHFLLPVLDTNSDSSLQTDPIILKMFYHFQSMNSMLSSL